MMGVGVGTRILAGSQPTGPTLKNSEQERAEKNIPHESDVETRWGLIAVASSPWSTREGPKKELLVWVDFSVVFTIEIVLSPSIVLESLLSFSFHFFRPQLCTKTRPKKLNSNSRATTTKMSEDKKFESKDELADWFKERGVEEGDLGDVAEKLLMRGFHKPSRLLGITVDELKNDAKKPNPLARELSNKLKLLQQPNGELRCCCCCILVFKFKMLIAVEFLPVLPPATVPTAFDLAVQKLAGGMPRYKSSHFPRYSMQIPFRFTIVISARRCLHVPPTFPAEA